MLSGVAFWGGNKCAPVSHKHMLSHPSFSSPLINEDLPAGPQLVFTLNNRFFRHQACYSLLPAKPGGQADRVVSLCKYKVVGVPYCASSISNKVCNPVCCIPGNILISQEYFFLQNLIPTQTHRSSSPGTRQTDDKNLVWFGEIERKLAKLSMPTFTYRSST